MVTWNLSELFESVVDVVGDRDAVVTSTARWTYGDLEERANRLAHVLSGHGVGAGDHVALALRNGNEYLEGMLAAFKLRAVPINVNTRYTTDELTHLLRDADPKVVLHEPDRLDHVRAAVTEGTPLLSRGAPYEEALAAAPSTRLDVADRSGDDRYVLYTGGTTGHPKGVVWRHEDLLFAALAGGNLGGDPVTAPEQVAQLAVSGRARCLPASPFTHGTAHWTALATLLSGGTVIVDTGTNLDAARLWDLAERERATILVIVGDAFAL
ncbi:MAG: AMP-binding protein, partial [Acidimicrobiales bacterium]|nr:AMP-binding protein [Acidimicrobiales bacterium]